MGAVNGPGSAPGVEGGAGIKGVSIGPKTPGGDTIDGVTGKGTPVAGHPTVLAGMLVTHGFNSGELPIPGVTGADVGPLPIAGG